MTLSSSTVSTSSSSQPATAPVPQQEQDCVICFEVPVTRGVIECCNHSFCEQCILQWSRVTNKCPVCKRVFRSVTTAPSSHPPAPVTAGKRKRTPKPKVHKIKNREQRVDENYGRAEGGDMLFAMIGPGGPMVGGLPLHLGVLRFSNWDFWGDDDDDEDYVDEENDYEEEEENWLNLSAYGHRGTRNDRQTEVVDVSDEDESAASSRRERIVRRQRSRRLGTRDNISSSMSPTFTSSPPVVVDLTDDTSATALSSPTSL